MATTATPSPVLPHQSNNLNNPSNGKQSGSRMLRTLSRFLSGGNKQTKGQSRPAKLDNTTRNNSDPIQLGHHRAEDEANLGSRGEGDSERTSRSTSVSTAGQASSLVAQYPNDSRSRLSRQNTSSTTSTSSRTSPPPSINEDDADTDASVYRLPPSTRGPSSVTSRQTTHTHDSSSSFAPTHASTYRSNASTKPTTLLSVDSGGGGNRIAVVPGTGHFHHHPGAGAGAGGMGMSTSNSGNSLSPTSSPSTQSPNHTFSSLSPTFVPTHTGHRPSTSSTTSSISIPPPLNSHPDHTIGIPSHTQAHPRNNPHPSQFPTDNASLLTLASSSFAPSFTLSTGERPTTERARNSWGGGGLTSLKAWSAKRGQVGGGGGNKRSLGGGGGVEADEDASVRVLPGSRRNSEESLGGRSTWSAMVPNVQGGGGRSVVSVKVGDHDLDSERERERDRERRRSSMKTVETGHDLSSEREQQREEEEAIETETEEGEAGEGERYKRREGETEAEGVKKRAEERLDPVGIQTKEEEPVEEKGKGKGVDLEEHEGLNLAPPVPMVME